MSIIKHVTLQNIVAHDFRYDPRISKNIKIKIYRTIILPVVLLRIFGPEGRGNRRVEKTT